MAVAVQTSFRTGARAATTFSSAPSTTCSLLSSSALRIPSCPPSGAAAAAARGQVRHATFVPRHRRPYQFTQLVQLSDGSTFTARTTMPAALYKSTKDTRNHILWQPSEKSLRNVEVDEAGKLAAFRDRFGHGWDLEAKKEGEEEAASAAAPADQPAAEPAAPREDDAFDSLVDLISGYAAKDQNKFGGLTAKEQEKLSKKKK